MLPAQTLGAEPQCFQLSLLPIGGSLHTQPFADFISASSHSARTGPELSRRSREGQASDSSLMLSPFPTTPNNLSPAPPLLGGTDSYVVADVEESSSQILSEKSQRQNNI